MGGRLEVATEGKLIGLFELPPNRPVVLGRSAEAGLAVESDSRISREHAELTLEGASLKVVRLAGSSNPIYQDDVKKEAFTLRPGESFRIGKTRFTFLGDEPAPSEAPRTEPLALKTLNATELYAVGDPSERLRLLDILELPELLRSRDRADFHTHIAAMLRASTGAAWACVVTEEGRVLGEEAGAAAVRYRPSRTLIRKALADAPQPTIYSWSKPGELLATAQAGIEWAICAAARVPGEPGMVFYASGGESLGTSEALQHDKARFVGLVADMVGRSLSVDRLQTWEGRLEHFFAGPVVSKILQSPDLRDLEPRLAVSTVLFFDIRGFSRRTEEQSQDILRHIGGLRAAMTAMTEIILDDHGVVLQYMGDGILACWNVPFDDPGHVDRACRSALRMAAALGKTTGGWNCGIGIHTGDVVAGAIGSEQVFSYGVLGPVVNQASRVEGITKLLGTPILATREVAERVSPAVAVPVRVGRYQPAGMSWVCELYELQEPPGRPERNALLARGLAALEKGRWEQALGLLDGLPADDGPAAFLRALALENRSAPPALWRGVITLASK